MIPVHLVLYSGFGLGDAVQFRTVLAHLHKYRPDWQIHFEAAPGMACVGRGLTATNSDDHPGHLDTGFLIQLQMCEDYIRFPDRPSTKAAFLLEHTFNIPYDHSLEATRFPIEVPARGVPSVGRVLLHYRGHSNAPAKDLRHEDAAAIADVEEPLLLDFDGHSSLPVGRVGREWQGVEPLAQLIGAARAFIGIDSGPGKVAGLTDTPSLICWTGHHPLRYHERCQNTTHLIPEGWGQMTPVLGDRIMAKFFEDHYHVRTYAAGGLAAEARQWLRETLK